MRIVDTKRGLAGLSCSDRALLLRFSRRGAGPCRANDSGCVRTLRSPLERTPPALIQTAVPIFYLHIWNGGGFVEDTEGQELPDAEAARKMAVEGLRDILAGELRNGDLNTASFIEIEDEQRRLVRTVSFEEAVRVTDNRPDQQMRSDT